MPAPNQIMRVAFFRVDTALGSIKLIARTFATIVFKPIGADQQHHVEASQCFAATSPSPQGIIVLPNISCFQPLRKCSPL